MVKFDTWTVDVPGKFRNDVTFLDLETRKVPCDWTSPAGELLTRRWSAFLAGVTGYRRITMVESVNDEEGFLVGVREAIESGTVVYRATRKFDEMILKGRYTYARRGPAPEPFYPAMPGAEDLVWACERPDPTGFWESIREQELPSIDVPIAYEAGKSGLVLVHLLRDVCELIGAYGEPDEECMIWLRMMLTDQASAFLALYGPETESK